MRLSKTQTSSSTEPDLDKPVRLGGQESWAYAMPVHTAVYVGAGAQERAAGSGVRPGVVDEHGVMVGAWSADFCGCWDHCVPNCFMVTCCPCVSLAQIASRIGVASYTRTLVLVSLLVVVILATRFLSNYVAALRGTRGPDGTDAWIDTPMEKRTGIDNFIDSGLFSLEVGARVAIILFVFQLRSKTRQRFEIKGSCCGDCWAAWCCTYCTMAQLATHVGSYKPGTCDFGPPDSLPPYEYPHE